MARDAGPAAPLSRDVLVIGAGPAGMAAAVAVARAGASVALVERDRRTGGILPQCVHDGFGLDLYGASLTGPELAARLAAELDEARVVPMLDTTVTGIGPDLGATLLGPAGLVRVEPRAVVLAMGCRERPFGALMIPSSRPAGIWSAGAAQRLVNIDGLTLGRRAVVIGSGDVGLIMARRLVLEGAEVACVVERLGYPGGLPRNVVSCLNDFGTPLLLRHTVIEVIGRRRVTGVVIAGVDDAGRPIEGTRRTVPCDLVLVSTGLIPENELTREAGAPLDGRTGGPEVDGACMTAVPGLFAAGNVLHVHDLADAAAREGARAGARAAAYATGPTRAATVPVVPGEGVRYVVPQRIAVGEPAELRFRVTEPMRRVTVRVLHDGAEAAASECAVLAPPEMAEIETPGPTAGTAKVEVRCDVR